MRVYRIYFRDERSLICGRHDFEADTEQGAIGIARILYDACSDSCETYELWDGQRMVPSIMRRDGEPALNTHHQEVVARTEELIRWSRWRIAESQRLLEFVEGKRR